MSDNAETATAHKRRDFRVSEARKSMKVEESVTNMIRSTNLEQRAQT